MKHHCNIYALQQQDILLYKIIGPTNVQSVSYGREYIESFIKHQSEGFYLIADLEEWELSTHDSSDMISSNQQHYFQQGCKGYIFIVKSEFYSDLIQTVLIKDTSLGQHFVTSMDEAMEILENKDVDTHLLSASYKAFIDDITCHEENSRYSIMPK